MVTHKQISHLTSKKCGILLWFLYFLNAPLFWLYILNILSQIAIKYNLIILFINNI